MGYLWFLIGPHLDFIVLLLVPNQKLLYLELKELEFLNFFLFDFVILFVGLRMYFELFLEVQLNV